MYKRYLGCALFLLFWLALPGGIAPSTLTPAVSLSHRIQAPSDQAYYSRSARNIGLNTSQNGDPASPHGNAAKRLGCAIRVLDTFRSLPVSLNPIRREIALIQRPDRDLDIPSSRVTVSYQLRGPPPA